MKYLTINPTFHLGGGADSSPLGFWTLEPSILIWEVPDCFTIKGGAAETLKNWSPWYVRVNADFIVIVLCFISKIFFF